MQSFLVKPGFYLCKTIFVDCTALCCWDSLANLCRGLSKKDMTPTAPSVPRRSPIQVLTVPDAAFSDQTRTGAFSVIWPVAEE